MRTRRLPLPLAAATALAALAACTATPATTTTTTAPPVTVRTTASTTSAAVPATTGQPSPSVSRGTTGATSAATAASGPAAGNPATSAPAAGAPACLPELGFCLTTPAGFTTAADQPTSPAGPADVLTTTEDGSGVVLAKVTAYSGGAEAGACGNKPVKVIRTQQTALTGTPLDDMHVDRAYVVQALFQRADGTWQPATFLSNAKEHTVTGTTDDCRQALVWFAGDRRIRGEVVRVDDTRSYPLDEALAGLQDRYHTAGFGYLSTLRPA